MCKDYNTEFLGALPLDIHIREQTDSGKPTVVADPDGRIAEIYRRHRAPRRGQNLGAGEGHVRRSSRISLSRNYSYWINL